MARFYEIHAKAIQRAASINRLRVGECFRIIAWEPLPPVLDRAPENATATIVTFRAMPDGRFEPADIGGRTAIAEWTERHRHTPDSAWQLPDIRPVAVGRQDR